MHPGPQSGSRYILQHLANANSGRVINSIYMGEKIDFFVLVQFPQFFNYKDLV
jgi:hypothetical protein